MEREKVEFWTYGSENGNIIINFDHHNGQSRYIEVSPKDIKCMMSWVLMDSVKYIPNWDKYLK